MWCIVQVKCLYESQSSGSAVPVSAAPSPLSTPVIPTADAATSIGASLYAPRPPPVSHTPGGERGNKGGRSDEADARGVDSCSVQTSTTLTSHDETSLHLDLPSYCKPAVGSCVLLCVCVCVIGIGEGFNRTPTTYISSIWAILCSSWQLKN